MLGWYEKEERTERSAFHVAMSRAENFLAPCCSSPPDADDDDDDDDDADDGDNDDARASDTTAADAEAEMADTMAALAVESSPAVLADVKTSAAAGDSDDADAADEEEAENGTGPPTTQRGCSAKKSETRALGLAPS